MFVFLVPTRYSSYTEVYNVIQCKMSHTCQCSLPIKPGKAYNITQCSKKIVNSAASMQALHEKN